MIPLIADNKDAIAEICRRFRIRKLDLFGSAATGDFDPETSDVDFVVDLGEHIPGGAWRFVDFSVPALRQQLDDLRRDAPLSRDMGQ